MKHMLLLPLFIIGNTISAIPQDRFHHKFYQVYKSAQLNWKLAQLEESKEQFQKHIELAESQLWQLSYNKYIFDSYVRWIQLRKSTAKKDLAAAAKYYSKNIDPTLYPVDTLKHIKEFKRIKVSLNAKTLLNIKKIHYLHHQHNIYQFLNYRFVAGTPYRFKVVFSDSSTKDFVTTIEQLPTQLKRLRPTASTINSVSSTQISSNIQDTTKNNAYGEPRKNNYLWALWSLGGVLAAHLIHQQQQSSSTDSVVIKDGI